MKIKEYLDEIMEVALENNDEFFDETKPSRFLVIHNVDTGNVEKFDIGNGIFSEAILNSFATMLGKTPEHRAFDDNNLIHSYLSMEQISVLFQKTPAENPRSRP